MQCVGEIFLIVEILEIFCMSSTTNFVVDCVSFYQGFCHSINYWSQHGRIGLKLYFSKQAIFLRLNFH